MFIECPDHGEPFTSCKFSRFSIFIRWICVCQESDRSFFAGTTAKRLKVNKPTTADEKEQIGK
jgi:hypothetical protein